MNQSYEAKYKQINEILRKTYENLLTLANHRSIGSLSELRPDQYDQAAITVLARRFGKQLWCFDESRSLELKDRCLNEALQENNRMLQYPDSLLQNPEVRSVLERARLLVREWMGDLKGWQPERSRSVFTMPPGEQYITSRGKVSVYQKFKNHSWTITDTAINDFTALVINTRWLRRVARDRMERKTSKRFNVLVGEAVTNLLSKKCWKSGESFDFSPPSTFDLWKDLLVSHLLDIVKGSRFSSVPKDTEKRRPINVEPLCNVILQLSLGKAIKNSLRISAGNDLFEGQTHHQECCFDSDYATIDFSGASDTIAPWLVNYLFPRDVSRKLMAYRSPFLDVGYNPSMFSFKPTDEIFEIQAHRYLNEARREKKFFNLKDPLPSFESVVQQLKDDNEKGRWVPQHKFASMGNGTTFEVLTVVLLALARSFDPLARAYGDDVLITVDKAHHFMQICETLGFKVNKEKSFLDGSFRESCGTFVFSGVEVHSFEIDQVINDRGVILATNKLLILSQRLSKHEGPCINAARALLNECRRAILRVRPLRSFRGPFAYDEWRLSKDLPNVSEGKPLEGHMIRYVNDCYVMDLFPEYTQSASVKVPQSVKDTVSCRLKQLNRPSQEGSGWHLLNGLEERTKLATKAPGATRDPSRIASYLLSNRVCDDVYRTPPGDKQFRSRLYLALADGTVHKLEDITQGCYCSISEDYSS